MELIPLLDHHPVRDHRDHPVRGLLVHRQSRARQAAARRPRGRVGGAPLLPPVRAQPSRVRHEEGDARLKSPALRSRYGRDQAPGAVVYLIAAALILISLEALLYLLLLKDTIGPFAFFGSVPGSLHRPHPARARAHRCGSGAPGEGNPAGERRLALWEGAARAAGLESERLPIARLDKAPVGKDVIVLPAITSLDEAARNLLLRSVNAGTGIVVSGSPGSRNASGGAMDHDLLQKLTGATAVETVTQGVCSVTFAGGRYYSDRVPAGRRLELPAQDLVVPRRRSRTPS